MSSEKRRARIGSLRRFLSILVLHFFGDVSAEEVIAALKKLQEEKALLKVENARLLDRLKEAEGGE